MYKVTLLAIAILGLVAAPAGRAQVMPACNADNDVNIDAADGGQPTAPPVAHVCKDKAEGKINLNISGAIPGNSLLIFKCQDPERSGESACRSPVLMANLKDSRWVIHLSNGKTKIPLASDPICADAYKRNPNEGTLKKFCSYPYMVVNVNNPDTMPLDPVWIVTP